jgi:outer membrane protein assembly factor BamB/predicted MPP superfamily phosphohydrolase
MTRAIAVSGWVLIEDEGPIADVLVSNGIDVVRTDTDGCYILPARSGCRFVQATVPGGFTADRFFLDGTTQDLADGKISLRRRAGGRPERFSFAHITDMHLSTERRCLPADLAEDLARLLEDGAGGIDLLVASGDLTAGGKPEEFAAYREVIDATGVPVFHAAGNHDDDAEVEGQNFQDALGPLSYSFDWGAVHFCVYDGQAHARKGDVVAETEEVFPYHPSSADEWLHADLAAQPVDAPVIIINHFPWGREFYDQWECCGIVAVLSGHWHSSRRHDTGGTVHYATPSLCFGGIDQSRRGYRLFTWSEQGLQSQMRIFEPKPLWPGVAALPMASPIEPAAPAVEKPLQADWPQFHGGPARQGSATTGPVPPLTHGWRTASSGDIHTAPCVVAEGRVYQTTMDDDAGELCGVTALDAATGHVCWRHQTAASIRHAAACWQDGVYAVTITGDVICLQSVTGELRWCYSLGEPSRRWVFSAPLACHGRIYAGVSSALVALDAGNGAVLWRREDFGVDDWISSYTSPAATEDRIVVAFYTQPTALAVLDAATGQTVWQLPGVKANSIYATPVIGEGVLFSVSGAAVRALDLETGASRWECAIRLGRIQATPALAGERLFVATGTGVLHAFHVTDGHELWRWSPPTEMPLFTPYARTGPTTLASPVVAGGVVWVAAADGCLYGLDETSGALLWSGDLGAPLAAAPAVGENALFLSATDGTVSALVGTG